MKDAGITKENTDFDRVGIFVGSGIGGLRTIQEQCELNTQKGNKRVSPMFIPMSISNIALDQNILVGHSSLLLHLGTVEDVANVVKFLASEESSYITGQVK